MMDILMAETCWAHKKWTKIASDIKLLFYSSNFTCDLYFVLLDVIFIRGEKVSNIWMENLKGRDHLQVYKWKREEYLIVWKMEAEYF